ncbi:MAG: winged helix-turn-helix domain-containing protein [Halorientalis sp.]
MSRTGIDAALDLLSNETRFDILRALATQRFTATDATGMTFSELFAAVDTDDSGNFNYHLKRLLGRLVTKDGEYYQLTHGGVQLFSSLQATTYAPDHDREQLLLDQPCPLCEEALAATYEEGFLTIGCETHVIIEMYVHPSWIESLSTDEFLDRVSLLLHHHIEKIVDGFCPLCYGELGYELRSDDDPYPIQYHYPCQQCGTELRLRPQQTVTRDDTVASFYRDHGIEIHETPPWELYDTYRDTWVVDDGPHTRFELVVGGDLAHVIVDGKGTLLSFERVD